MLGSITPHLIAIGVVFVLALVITFAVNRKTVADAVTRKLIHSESWLVFLVLEALAIKRYRDRRRTAETSGRL